MKQTTDTERRRQALIAGASFAGALFTFEALDRVWHMRPIDNAVKGLRNVFGGK